MTKNLDLTGLQSIAHNYDLFYIDLWGVIHNGVKLNEKAVIVLEELLKNNKTFVLLSDGELDEGSNWEALLFSTHHKLNNLVIIIDYNKIQSIGLVKKTLNLEPISKKFKSFGCKTISINGHNYNEIVSAINIKSSKPLVIIANTLKGKGVKFMENSVLWHYKPLDKESFQKAINILK